MPDTETNQPHKIVATTSKQGTLNWKDILKGLLVAVITPVFTVITTSLDAGILTFNWKAIWITAVSAGVAYLMKNLFTPSQTIVKITPSVDEKTIEQSGSNSK